MVFPSQNKIAKSKCGQSVVLSGEYAFPFRLMKPLLPLCYSRIQLSTKLIAVPGRQHKYMSDIPFRSTATCMQWVVRQGIGGTLEPSDHKSRPPFASRIIYGICEYADAVEVRHCMLLFARYATARKCATRESVAGVSIITTPLCC